MDGRRRGNILRRHPQDKKLRDEFSFHCCGVHAVALDSATGRLEGAGDPRRGGIYREV